MTTDEAISYGEDYLKDLINAACPIGEKHINFVKMAIKALKAEPDADYKTLLIKLENAEDVIRGLREELRDAREEMRQRW